LPKVKKSKVGKKPPTKPKKEPALNFQEELENSSILKEPVRNESTLAKVKAMLGLTSRTDDIAKKLGITDEEVKEMRDVIYFEEEANKMGLDNRFVYASYLLKSEWALSRLENLVSEMESQQLTGIEGQVFLGAIKIRQEILNQIIKIGQSLGIVDEEAKKVLNVNVNMNVNEMIKIYKEKTKQFENLKNRYGKKDDDDIN